MMNHAFSPKSIHSLIPTFSKHTKALLKILEDQKEVDMSVLFTKLTLDIIGESAFSFQFNSLKEP
jgi:cytochrome P450